MAAPNMAVHPASQGSGNFVLGLVVGVVFMIATVLTTLWSLGYLQGRTALPEQPSVSHVFTADDLEAPAKPTPAWRFRSEWTTPQPK
jgi:hypothetical protein